VEATAEKHKNEILKNHTLSLARTRASERVWPNVCVQSSDKPSLAYSMCYFLRNGDPIRPTI
jgi:hypothetical protein